MKVICGIVALAVCGAAAAQVQTTLYVAPNGKDAWKGDRAVPAPDGGNGPFKTLERARDEIRRIKAAGGLPAGGIVVELQEGTYELARPFELGEEDSGSAGAPIVYRARPDGDVRLLGGRIVKGFQPVTDPDILDRLEPSARGHVLEANLKTQGITDYGPVPGGGIELFFRHEPMQISRWPNRGFTKIVRMVGEATKRDRGMTHKVGKWVYAGDRPSRWTREKEIWVDGYWFYDWSEQRHRVKSIDLEKHIMEVAPPYHAYGYRAGKWYYAFNLLSEIDMPGEWYLDRETGILYFWPPAPPREGDALVSVLPTIVTMKNVSHVTFEKLLIEGGRADGLHLNGGTKNRIVGCIFRNLGGWGLRIGGVDNGVIGCDVYNTGRGGISLSGGDRKTLTPAGLFAENNHVHHYARIKRVYQPGITLSGVGNRASHNLIDNAPHMAMGFGGNDHLIEFNEIHSVCYESNDAGAIYTGRNWTMRGNRIRYNYLHHINGFEGRGCVGVYLDDCFSSAAIYGNVFYKVTRAAMIGGGRDCSIENNIFIDCVPAVHIDARGVGWAHRYIVPGGGWHMQEKLAEVPYRKPPWTKYPHLANILEDDPYLPKYDTVVHNIFVGGTWNGIRPKARPHVKIEGNIIDKDVGFVNAAAGDFRLRDDSPAYALGFKPIPFAQIGVYKDAKRASWPVVHSIRPLAVPPPPPPKPKRGPAPVWQVPKTAAHIVVDGVLTPEEWFGLDEKKAMVIEQGVHGEKRKPRTFAWLSHDDMALYIGIRNFVSADSPLRTKAEWGENDAVEIACRNPAIKGASILVLRGYPAGQFESSTEAGAPFEVAKDLEKATHYAARVVSKKEWTAEWKVPLAALGIDLKKARTLQFNLSVRKTAGNQWIMWRGTLGYTWQVDKAGKLELAP